jgi:hypothetical protein
VDCRNNRLLDGVTSLSTPVQAASPRIPSIKVISGGTSVDTLISEFLDLTRPLEFSGKCVTIPSTTSVLHQAHQPLTDQVDWHLTGSQSPKPSSRPWYAMVLFAVLRVLCPPHYTSCPRRATVGVPAATIEHSTPEPFPTATRPPYTRLHSPAIWLPFFLQDRPGEGLQPNSRSPQRHEEDRHHHSFWPIRVSLHVIRLAQRHPRRFSASWTTFCGESTSASLT